MFKTISNIIWLFLLVGVLFLFSDPLRTNRAFYNFYTIALQFYMFGVCAYLVLKRVIFYRLRGDVNVVSLSKKSEYQLNLVMQGVVLSLVYLVYVRSYGNLKSIDTIIISVLLFYYVAQVFINGDKYTNSRFLCCIIKCSIFEYGSIHFKSFTDFSGV